MCPASKLGGADFDFVYICRVLCKLQSIYFSRKCLIMAYVLFKCRNTNVSGHLVTRNVVSLGTLLVLIVFWFAESCAATDSQGYVSYDDNIIHLSVLIF